MKSIKRKLVRYKCPHCDGRGFTMVSPAVKKMLKRFGRSAVVWKKEDPKP